MESKYKNEILNGKVNIRIYFATLYNKTNIFSGAECWKSHSVTKNFTKEELLIGSDFWNYICEDDDAYNQIIKLYDKYCHCSQQAITDLKNKVRDEISEKIKDLPEDIQELYIKRLC